LGEGTWGPANLTPDKTNPVSAFFDSDADGCLDTREQGFSASVGGLRNPKDFWDFFDTPDGANNRDRVVNVADISRVVGRFGSSGSSTTPADGVGAAPPAPAYHAAFDRTPGTVWYWRSGPANGSITIEDITRIVAQFGHSCV
jgi:hypothetical protein